MKINIIDFLRSGEFGGLSATTTQVQVKDMFGAPDAYSRERRGVVIWRFGRVQFFFLRKRLVQIFVYYSSDAEAGKDGPTSFLEDQFASSPTLPAFRAFFDSVGISWRIKPELTFENQTCLKLSSGVELIFDADCCAKIGKSF